MRIIKNIVCWTLIVVLSFLVITFMITRFSGGTPSVFGYTLQRVETGSMEPAIEAGDVILSKTVNSISELSVNDIITYKGGKIFDNRKITHRIIQILGDPVQGENAELLTKGDANEIADQTITMAAVESKMVKKLEFLKKFYEFYLSPWGLIIFIVLLLFIFFDELINIIRIATHTLPEDKEESISEIIERLQREDAEKAELERQREEQISRDMVEIMANSDEEEKIGSDED